MFDSNWGPLPSFPFVIVLVMYVTSSLARGFDIRRHLGTKTRYAYRLAVPGAPSIYKAPDPEGYDPVHLYLLARHGTRWPTGDRMRQINSLEKLFKDARNTLEHPWLRNWTAPFPDVSMRGGELHPIGADELWGLAYRLRKRFPSLARQDYLPKRFPVISTQVARTAASASAFTAGFFPDVGSHNPADDSPAVNPAPRAVAAGGAVQEEAVSTLPRRGDMQHLESRGSLQRPVATARVPLLDDLDESLTWQPTLRRPQAVAMSMAPKDADPLLRFFDVCPAYAQHDEFTERWMSGWMQGNWSRLVPALESRLGLSRPMDPCEVEALWQLCLLEAGLQGQPGQACGLFEDQEALVLEWVDDIHLVETQSYGASINYDIAAPLLHDAVTSLRQAAAASADSGTDPSAPTAAARFLFAHCETLVPLATLLGLFRPAVLPPPPPPRAEMDAAVSAAAAQAHVRGLEALEDLELMVEGLKDLNARSARRDPSSLLLTSEDLPSTCYKGRPQPLVPQPPAPGWRPMLPPDDDRLFKGARIAPFGANLALVLYRRREGAAEAGGRPAHLVRLLYNEQVLPVPGCEGSGGGGADDGDMDCDLERFLELVKDKIDPNALDRLCGSNGDIVHGDGGASLMYGAATGGVGSAAAAS